MMRVEGIASGGMMNRKAAAIVLIVGLSLALAAALRTANRANASAGDCYSDTPGPSTPMVCN
jgi:hypothetical protein